MISLSDNKRKLKLAKWETSPNNFSFRREGAGNGGVSRMKERKRRINNAE